MKKNLTMSGRSQAGRTLMTTGLLLSLISSYHCQKAHSHGTPLDEAALTARDFGLGTIRHIVMFRYKSSTTAAEKENVITSFLALKFKCKRDGIPYIRSVEYGFPNAKGGADQGMEVAFFVTFDSEGDRNFYEGTPYIMNPVYYDKDHAQFKSMVTPLLASDGAIVYDYRKLP